MQEAKYKVKGVVPLLLHNGHLADPLDGYAKALKKLTSNRNKTDEIHMAIAEMEFRGGIYTNDAGRVIFPGQNIEKALILGARKLKLGKQFESGVWCHEDPELQYKGPKSVDALWASGKFADRQIVGIQQSKTARTRPRFDDWALEFTLVYDGVNKEQLDQVMDITSRIIGFGDYRPKFGRFQVL